MKSQLQFLLLLLLSTVSPITSLAHDIEIDGIYYSFDIGKKTVSVTNKDDSAGSYSGDIVIPSSITYRDVEYPVTGIGASAFASCFDLTSVSIPNTVTSIGRGAFYYCSSLPSINIPISVKSIGEMAFRKCTSLTSVIIPDSVTSLGNSAFSACM